MPWFDRLDPDKFASGRREPEEVARPASGFEDATAVETQIAHRGPHLLDHCGRGVVGVQGRPTSLIPRSIVAEQHSNACPLVIELGLRLVEDLGQASPPGPACEHALVVMGGRSTTVDRSEDFEGSDVGVELRSLPGGCEVALAGWPERYGRCSVGSLHDVASRDSRSFNAWRAVGSPSVWSWSVAVVVRSSSKTSSSA